MVDFIFATVLTVTGELIKTFHFKFCNVRPLMECFGVVVFALVCNSLWRRSLQFVRNKAVLVTGCDSGFGLQLALDLCDQGVQVFAACLSLQSIGARRLLALQNPLMCVIKCDVTSDDDVMLLSETIQQNIAPLRCQTC